MGSYVGGLMAKAGEDVTLIDPWPDHIAKIRESGLLITGPEVEHRVMPKTLHIHEVQGLIKTPVDVAMICTKSYDTEWASMLIKEYLSPEGFVVSLQNSINEERIASIVGWGRTVGCIASTLGVELVEPGHVNHTYRAGGPDYAVFRVGEPHGRITRRVEELVNLLSLVDSAKATTNLWGERWSKLVLNSMSNPVYVITGLNEKQMAANSQIRKLIIRLAAEAVAVGEAIGYALEPILGLEAHRWTAATQGNGLEELEAALLHVAERATDAGRSSTYQDFVKGRRTEIEFLNGLVVAKGRENKVPTPTNEAIIALVNAVMRGEVAPSVANVDGLLAAK